MVVTLAAIKKIHKAGETHAAELPTAQISGP